MSTPKKPRGTTGAVPELTKLKLLWRDSLDEAQRDFWRSQFAGTSTQAQLRALLKREHGINLSRDNQLTEFRSWLEAQDAMDSEAERQAEEETRLRSEHPDWDADRLRQEVISSAMRRAIVTGDFTGLGFRAVKADLAERSAKFNAELETEKLKLARQAEARQQEALKLERQKFELLAAEKMLDQALRRKAEEIAASNLSHADKIAAMRQAAFADVDALQASGQIKLPE